MIKFNSNEYLDLHLPENDDKPKNILILGNTFNMFGHVDDNKKFDIRKTCSKLNNITLYNLITYVLSKSKFTIVGTEELVNNYYTGLIEHLNSFCKCKYNKITLEKFSKKKGIKPKKTREWEILYCEILDKLASKNKKFDIIIMNPPYSWSLHLQILERSIKMLKNKDSICINLSPVRWIQDPLALYRGRGSDLLKYEDSVAKHIKSLDIIDYYRAYTLFNVDFSFDIGLYILDNQEHTLYKEINTNTIIEKVYDSLLPSYEDFVEKDKIDGYRCRLQKIRPIVTGKRNMTNIVLTRLFETTSHNLSWVYKDGYTEDGKYWSENVTQGAVQRYKKGDMIPESIKFKSLKEAKNFENSTKTNFSRYLVLKMKVSGAYPMGYMPFMYKEKNKRTGLIGYKSEWLDEDFYEFFNITEKEQEIIEKTMSKYNI